MEAFRPYWQSMETAPRDGSPFVVKQVQVFQHGSVEELMIVRWDEYSDAQGGWWLPEGAVIPYSSCVGWSPIPNEHGAPNAR